MVPKPFENCDLAPNANSGCYASVPSKVAATKSSAPALKPKRRKSRRKKRDTSSSMSNDNMVWMLFVVFACGVLFYMLLKSCKAGQPASGMGAQGMNAPAMGSMTGTAPMDFTSATTSDFSATSPVFSATSSVVPK